MDLDGYAVNSVRSFVQEIISNAIDDAGSFLWALVPGNSKAKYGKLLKKASDSFQSTTMSAVRSISTGTQSTHQSCSASQHGSSFGQREIPISNTKSVNTERLPSDGLLVSSAESRRDKQPCSSTKCTRSSTNTFIRKATFQPTSSSRSAMTSTVLDDLGLVDVAEETNHRLTEYDRQAASSSCNDPENGQNMDAFNEIDDANANINVHTPSSDESSCDDERCATTPCHARPVASHSEDDTDERSVDGERRTRRVRFQQVVASSSDTVERTVLGNEADDSHQRYVRHERSGVGTSAGSLLNIVERDKMCNQYMLRTSSSDTALVSTGSATGSCSDEESEPVRRQRFAVSARQRLQSASQSPPNPCTSPDETHCSMANRAELHECTAGTSQTNDTMGQLLHITDVSHESPASGLLNEADLQKGCTEEQGDDDDEGEEGSSLQKQMTAAFERGREHSARAYMRAVRVMENRGAHIHTLKEQHEHILRYMRAREEEWDMVRDRMTREIKILRRQNTESIAAKMDAGYPLNGYNVRTLLRAKRNLDQALVAVIERQNKVNELSLSLRQQQQYIIRLEDEIRQLQERNLLLTNDAETQGRPTGQLNALPLRTASDKGRYSSMMDVLPCDRSDYTPGVSTSPDVTMVDIFSFAGKGQVPVEINDDLSYVFTPLDLPYTRGAVMVEESQEELDNVMLNIITESITSQ